MPRILRILNRLIIGGPATNATLLSRYLAPAYETMLVIGGKDDHEQDAAHMAESLGLAPVVVPQMLRAINLPADRAAYKKVKALIQDFKPHIVHTHAAKSGAIGRLAAHACRVPVVVHTFHGHVFHSYFGKARTRAFVGIERYLARRSTGIIAISDIQKEELSAQYRICPAEQIKVIPLGLDLDKFSQRPSAQRAAFRAAYGIAAGEVAIGIVGRIVPVKNHGLFVAAAAQVAAQAGTRIRFIIIGDGDVRPALEAQIAQAGLSYQYVPTPMPSAATVICTSWIHDMAPVMAGLDVVALTSHNEGTPLSLIEAQAAGVPVVSTRVGGVADVVPDGKSGFITEAGNVEQFSNALLRLANDANLRQTMGEAGRAFAKGSFSYQRLMRDMDSYYQELLAANI